METSGNAEAPGAFRAVGFDKMAGRGGRDVRAARGMTIGLS